MNCYYIFSIYGEKRNGETHYLKLTLSALFQNEVSYFLFRSYLLIQHIVSEIENCVTVSYVVSIGSQSEILQYSQQNLHGQIVSANYLLQGKCVIKSTCFFVTQKDDQKQASTVLTFPVKLKTHQLHFSFSLRQIFYRQGSLQ